jgi:preprotein translocase subunit SecA
MERFGLEEDQPIEHALLTRAIENAQKKVEAHNFDIRKHLLEYDDVMNKQREVIYSRRREILASEEIKDDVLEMAEGLAAGLAEEFADQDRSPESWDLHGLREAFSKQFGVEPRIDGDPADLTRDRLTALAVEQAAAAYEAKEREIGAPVMRFLERQLFLTVIDSLWKDHLLNMDQLKEGIGLRGYGQRDPLREYQREAYDLFEEMFETIEIDTVERLMHVQITRAEPAAAGAGLRPLEPAAPTSGAPANGAPAAPLGSPGGRLAPLGGGPQGGARVYNRGAEAAVETVRREAKKVGRNDPCPCGSGKKYKKCHGQ